jgi:hypothetical protein
VLLERKKFLLECGGKFTAPQRKNIYSEEEERPASEGQQTVQRTPVGWKPEGNTK